MNALVFLGIALVLSMAGCLVLWFRSRQPGSMEAHIRDFARELDALAPGSPGDRTRGRPGVRDARPPAQGAPRPPGGEGPLRPPPRPRPGPRTERPAERSPGPERGDGPERPSEPGTEWRSG